MAVFNSKNNLKTELWRLKNLRKLGREISMPKTAPGVITVLSGLVNKVNSADFSIL